MTTINNSDAPAGGADTRPRSRTPTWLSILLGGGVSLVALFFIARSVDVAQTLQAITHANLVLFLLAFLVQVVAMGFTIRRWQVLLRPYPTRFWELAQIYFSAHLLNTLLPAKLGTVARVLLASEAEKLNVGLVFGSVAIEKILDTVVTLVLLLVLSPFIPLPVWLREALTASVVIVLVALVVAAGVARFRTALLDGVARIETRIFGSGAQRITSLVRGIIASLVNLTQRREAFDILFWTLLIWLAGGAVNLLLFYALGLDVSWSAMWFVMIVLQIGTRVPALPANLGVFHYLVILALALYGAGESPALAFAILLHLIVFILPAFLGAVWALPLSARLLALVTKGAPRIELGQGAD